MTRFSIPILAAIAFLMFIARLAIELVAGDVGAEPTFQVLAAAALVVGVCALLAATIAVLWGPPARRYIIVGDASPLDDRPSARERKARSILRHAGVMSMLAIAGVALLGCSSGCSGVLKQEGKAILHDAIQCTTDTAKARVAQYGGVVEAAIELATGADGRVDKAKLADSAKGFALDDGMCVLAELVARHRADATKPDDPGSPKSAGLEANPDELVATFRELAGGRTYETSYGPL